MRIRRSGFSQRQSRVRAVLYCESLEHRFALSCDTIGHISGTTYLDHNSNGSLDPAEALPSVQVQLFRDMDDNGQWNSTVDELLLTRFSNVAGMFEFDQLAAGTYFVVQPTQVVSGTALDLKVSSPQTISRFVGTIIDDFDVPSEGVEVGNTEVGSDEIVTSDTHALGGQRDLLVTTASDGVIRLRTAASRLELDSGIVGIGTFAVTWDGVDEPNAGLQVDGLQRFDLTEAFGVSGRASGLCLQGMLFDHPGVSVSVKVYSDSENYSEAEISPVINVDNTEDPSTDYFMSFQDRGGAHDFQIASGNGADFTSVGAMVLTVQTTVPGTDGFLDDVVTYGATSRQILIANSAVPDTNLGTIEGIAWNDGNRNGVRDANEPVLSGVPVELWQQGELITACTTDADGHYLFEGLLPDEYVVRTDIAGGVQTAPAGRFDVPTTLTSDPLVRGTVLFDWQSDDDADLALVSDFTNRVTIYANDRNAVFTEEARLDLPDRPHGIMAGDLDQNGFDDLVVTLLGARPRSGPVAANVVIFWQQPDGSFTSTTLLADDGPISVALADFNGDTRLDIVTANSRSDTISYFLNRGDRGFAPRTDFFVGQSPLAVAAGDLNGDGAADLIVANFLDDQVVMLAHDSTATFKSPVVLATGIGPAAVAVSDLDQNGRMDLVATFFGRLDRAGTFHRDDRVAIVYQQTNGLVAGPTIPLSRDARSDWFRLGDIDADGDVDIAILESEHNRIATYRRNSAGEYQFGEYLTAPESPEWMELGRLNDDAHLDIVAPGLGGALLVQVFQRGDFQVSVDLNQPLRDIDFGLDGVSSSPLIIPCSIRQLATSQEARLPRRVPRAPLPAGSEATVASKLAESVPSVDFVWSSYGRSTDLIE